MLVVLLLMEMGMVDMASRRGVGGGLHSLDLRAQLLDGPLVLAVCCLVFLTELVCTRKDLGFAIPLEVVEFVCDLIDVALVVLVPLGRDPHVPVHVLFGFPFGNDVCELGVVG